MNARARLPIAAAIVLAAGVLGTSAGAQALLGPPDTRLDAIRWVPRPKQATPSTTSTGATTTDGTTGGYIEIHGGFFDREGGVARSGVLGARFGASFNGRVQLGVAIDWNHRSDLGGTLVSSTELPGGGSIQQRLDTLRVSSDLLPALGFIEVAPFGAGPYIGVAGGYETLFLGLDNYESGDSRSATFDGWGWQYYAGLAFPLSRQARFSAEVLTNDGDLERDVYDPDLGVTLREVIDVGGVGARFGLGWRF